MQVYTLAKNSLGWPLPRIETPPRLLTGLRRGRKSGHLPLVVVEIRLPAAKLGICRCHDLTRRHTPLIPVSGVIAFLTMFTHGAVREGRRSREEQHLRCIAPPASSAFSSGAWQGPTEAVSAHGPVSYQHNTYYVRTPCLPFFSFLHPSVLLTSALPSSSMSSGHAYRPEHWPPRLSVLSASLTWEYLQTRTRV